MKIQSFETRDSIESTHCSCEIESEDSNYPMQKLWFDIKPPIPIGFYSKSSAFLITAAFLAWARGEGRLLVDDQICPVLCENLLGAFTILRNWYPELGAHPCIESPRNGKSQIPSGDGALSFISFGVDSLATLRRNRLFLPDGHPERLSSVLSVDFGKEPGISREETNNLNQKRHVSGLELEKETGINYYRVSSNLLHLLSDGNFFTYKWHGSILAAVGHLFSGTHSSGLIASSYDYSKLEPWGSHPMLDPCFSSSAFRIVHDGASLNRLQKVRLLADWQFALNNLLVCQGQHSSDGNCGSCEKCIRTKLELLVTGALAQSKAFKGQDISPDLVATLDEYKMLYNDSQLGFYQELIDPCIKIGRRDIAEAIQKVLTEFKERVEIENSRILRKVAEFVPRGRKFIIVDRDQYGVKFDAWPIGRFWGPPFDGISAVRELRSLIAWGGQYLLITENGLWWLDYYPLLAEFLSQHAVIVINEESWKIFELSKT